MIGIGKPHAAVAALVVALALLGVASAAAAVASRQTVTCSGKPCKTPMRLTCHSGSGQVTLSHIPKGSFDVYWKFRRRTGGWVYQSGPLSASGRITTTWPGVRRAQAGVDVPVESAQGNPETQYVITTKCGR